MRTFPAWAWMWTASGAVYAGCKWLTWHAAAPAGPRWRHAGYLLAWPGLDAPGFFDAGRQTEPVRFTEWIAAASALGAGLLFFFHAARFLAPGDLYATGWIGMVGLLLTRWARV